LSHCTWRVVDQEGRDDLYRYCNRERRSVLEVLSDFPSATPPLPWLLTIIPRLQPRYFSMSSSPRQHARTAHLAVAVVAWQVLPLLRKRGHVEVDR
jgi:sulfite reductase alpha subunit-like flavoprotein